MNQLILGIDPSLARTGWGLIELYQDNIKYLAHGVIVTPKSKDMQTRLVFLYDSISGLLAKYTPSIVAIEETFCGVNPVTTLRLGFAYGTIVTACGKSRIESIPYPTRKIKQILTGNGASKKEQVYIEVVKSLNNQAIDNLDSSDALAAAITHVRLSLHRPL